MNRCRLAIAAVLVLACTACSRPDAGSYGDERAKIEDLQARYLFAFDWNDAEGYASTFTEDGILNFGWGEIKGRQAIREFIDPPGQAQPESGGERPREGIGRHIISNIVVKIDGDRATGQAYWTHMTTGPTGYGTVDFFGHYEDEMVKVDGEWLFSKRYVFNEAIPEWASQPTNPVVTPSPPPKERPRGGAAPAGDAAAAGPTPAQ
jgi:uncharacterized protein (TIGR02246 family)